MLLLVMLQLRGREPLSRSVWDVFEPECGECHYKQQYSRIQENAGSANMVPKSLMSAFAQESFSGCCFRARLGNEEDYWHMISGFEARVAGCVRQHRDGWFGYSSVSARIKLHTRPRGPQ